MPCTLRTLARLLPVLVLPAWFLGGTASTVSAQSGRITNFSARAFSGQGGEVLVSGFALGGGSTRPVLLRAVGPGLATYGVTRFMLDPELRLYRSNGGGEMANDSWGDSPDLAAVHRRLGAFSLGDGSRDAAFVIPLSPGPYTAHAVGRGGSTGEVLLELYDAADSGDRSQSLTNVSLRGALGGENPLLIGGFVISTGAAKRVLVRAVGPTLAQFGVSDALGNPRIRLYRGGTVVAENDDWAPTGTDSSAMEAAYAQAGAFRLPRGSLDAALLLTLEPGAYTAHVEDPSGGRGVVLMEIYDLEPPAPGGVTGNPDPGAGEMPLVSIIASQPRIREGANPGGSVLLVRSGALDQPLRVYLAHAGTATAADIAGVPASVLIPAGSATASVPVSAWNDATWEPTELLSITVQPDAAYRVSGTATVRLVIDDVTASVGSGWRGEYFNNTSLAGTPALTRDDAKIDFAWKYASPDSAINVDNFSARWTGYIEAPVSGNYTLTTRTDDGVRLWIDEQRVIDYWIDQSGIERSATVTLTAGVRYAVRMEYYERGGGASAALYWIAPGRAREVVPTQGVFQLPSAAPSITSPRSALTLVGAPFSYAITAAGGPTSYAVLDLPDGLSFNASTGVISGAATSAGEYTIVVQASNSRGTGSELLTLSVLDAGAAPESERWTSAPAGLDAPATAPSSTATLDAFESATPAGTAFERIRGFIVAPESGNTTFWIAASGPARLYIADSDQPADRWDRARVATSSGNRAWTATTAQASAPIVLEAGHRYYFELVHRPSASGAHASVAWRLPSAAAGSAPVLVPAYALSRYTDAAAVDDGRQLFLGSLRPAGGVVSPASGLVSLLLDEPARTASITLRMSGLSSSQIAAYVVIGREGEQGPLIKPLPNGQFNNFTWQITDTGNFTAGDLIEALHGGLLHVVVYSSRYPEGELSGHFGGASGSSTFRTPAAPPAFDLATVSDADAARFLTQATFGPTMSEISRVKSQGYQRWLNDQFGRATGWHLQYIDALAAELALRDPPEQVGPNARMEAWWNKVLKSPDQLRQRVAFALSEILVTSDQGVLSEQPIGLTVYYDILLRHAFGNFRDLLGEVTLSPAMGNYLSMLRNQKGDPARGTLPDENYAREVMQLFSIGLNKLHPDGTLVLDSHGAPIPTYTQETIMGLARVFTGWSYHAPAGEENFRYGAREFRKPMMLYPEYHETGDKRLLESAIMPGGGDGAAELHAVLDLLFQHPNTGPFIARQLIQRLVTSNPSPGYVYRVARAFDDNGSGVRGDLRAVVQAILLDYEARSPAATAAIGYGKLREPLLRVTHLWRAFNASAPEGFPYAYHRPERDLSQAAMRSPTVFNFFEPGHVHPGVLAAAGLVAPEFQITNEQSMVATTNLLRRAVYGGVGSSEYPITIDIGAVLPMAGDTNRLLDWMNLVLLSGQMTPTMRTALTTALDAMGANADATERVRTVIHLIVTSSEYAAQR